MSKWQTDVLLSSNLALEIQVVPFLFGKALFIFYAVTLNPYVVYSQVSILLKQRFVLQMERSGMRKNFTLDRSCIEI